MVAERAVSALYYMLHDLPDGPIAISWLEQVWGIERAGSRAAAKAFISYTLELPVRRNLWNGPRLLAQDARDTRQRWSAAAPVFNRLVASQGSAEERRWLLNSIFHGRWTLSEYDRETDFVRIVDNGPGYPPLDPVWMVDPRGRSFGEFPDKEFGAWITALHKRVAQSGQPLVDDVDAIVRWPKFGDLRTRYWRMILPLDSDERSCRLLSVTGNGSGIYLRPKNVEETRDIVGHFGGAHPH